MAASDEASRELCMSQALAVAIGGLCLRWRSEHGASWLVLAGMAATPAWRFVLRFDIEGLHGVREILPAAACG